MLTDTGIEQRYLELLAEMLDIPPSLYERAVQRHHSLGDWLCRDASRLKQLNPHVSPQGSFRHGTVVRPLVEGAEYDLDNVTTLQMSKVEITQKDLKALYGLEMKDYARAHGMLAPVEEKNRCWRLSYADEERFHLDSLPSLAEDESVIGSLRTRNVPDEFAKARDCHYGQTPSRLRDHHDRMADKQSARLRSLVGGENGTLRAGHETSSSPTSRSGGVQRRIYASVDDVPTYALKTPLQRAIQLLKRHRDVMFADAPDLAPISMVLTNLSGHAYGGEADVYLAARGILGHMLTYRSSDATVCAQPDAPGRGLRGQMVEEILDWRRTSGPGTRKRRRTLNACHESLRCRRS